MKIKEHNMLNDYDRKFTIELNGEELAVLTVFLGQGCGPLDHTEQYCPNQVIKKLYNITCPVVEKYPKLNSLYKLVMEKVAGVVRFGKLDGDISEDLLRQ